MLCSGEVAAWGVLLLHGLPVADLSALLPAWVSLDDSSSALAPGSSLDPGLQFRLHSVGLMQQ